jgi:hypothetical protein
MSPARRTRHRIESDAYRLQNPLRGFSFELLRNISNSAKEELK